MSLRETLYTVNSLLNVAEIDHALIGGLALAMHGIHRATFDVDFLAEGTKREKIIHALESAGWKMSLGTEEVLHFRGKGQVDVLLANRPLSLEMLSQAKQEKGLKVLIPEAIIGLKIQAYCNDKNREFQDKADIKALIKGHENLNWEKIRQYADLFGEWPFVESCRRGQ